MFQQGARTGTQQHGFESGECEFPVKQTRGWCDRVAQHHAGDNATSGFGDGHDPEVEFSITIDGSAAVRLDDDLLLSPRNACAGECGACHLLLTFTERDCELFPLAPHFQY